MRRLATLAAQLSARPLATYIVAERDRLLPLSREFSRHERVLLGCHFSRLDLDRVRIATGCTAKEPRLLSAIRRIDHSISSPSLVEAITFDFLIASLQPLGVNTLVHELVHTVQYRLLGISKFSFRYAEGFFAVGYEDSPLEQMARDLADRFCEGKRFDAEQEVRNGIASL